MSENTKTASLATGAPLTQETWADFTQRLIHNCRGEGVKEHYTADAIFIVQAKNYIYGLEQEFAEQVVITCEESIFESALECWDQFTSKEK